MHKENLAMCPILLATHTYNYTLDKWLDDQINQYNVTETYQFLNEIQDLVINNGDILVSYDITLLFTYVPLEETISILADRAFTDHWFNKTHELNLSKSQLVDLLRAATKRQLFQFDGNLYEQTDKAAMGSPVAPLLANIFTCSIKEKHNQDGKVFYFYR